MFKFELGQKLKCRVTGFSGICVARTQYLNGCRQYGIKPPTGKDGKIIEAEWIDEAQIQFMGNGISVAKKETGGPSADAPRC